MVLSVLVQQMKKEGRCDVFTAVRKLRAQRQGMVQDLTQVFILSFPVGDWISKPRDTGGDALSS